MKAVSILVVGVVLGAALTVPAIRLARDPNSAPGKLRALVHLGPAASLNGSEPGDPVAQELAKRYGPAKHSQFLEEWIIRDVFQDKRGGVFVDIGAADNDIASNTWFLEKNLGWSGVAIDAQDRYRDGWEKNRPRSKFMTAFVSDTSNEKARLFLSQTERWVASYQEKFTENWGKVAGSIEVPTITLNDALAATRVTAFDFMSLDIELSEPKALAGFDIERFKPSLLCVEAHPLVRQQILDYFAAHHYTVVGKYLAADKVNLWFMPIGTILPSAGVPESTHIQLE